MRARRYDDILRARGYKVLEHTDYQGLNVYVKKHKYNTITCNVIKDTHGKAQAMDFVLTTQFKYEPEIAKEADLDRDYLLLEADKIHKAFEELRQMKSPKHIYF